LVDGHNPAKTGKRSRLIGADTVYSTRACCLHTTFHYYTKKTNTNCCFFIYSNKSKLGNERRSQPF